MRKLFYDSKNTKINDDVVKLDVLGIFEKCDKDALIFNKRHVKLCNMINKTEKESFNCESICNNLKNFFKGQEYNGLVTFFNKNLQESNLDNLLKEFKTKKISPPTCMSLTNFYKIGINGGFDVMIKDALRDDDFRNKHLKF